MVYSVWKYLHHDSTLLNQLFIYLDLLGSTAFATVQSDLKGNIAVGWVLRYKSVTHDHLRKFVLDMMRLLPNRPR